MKEDWKSVELGKVCKLKNGYAFKSKSYKSKGIPIIRISDIKDGKVLTDKSVHSEPSVEYENYEIKKGDILVAMSGATTGKFGIYNKIERAYQNQRVGKFEILKKSILENKFLYYHIYALKRKIEKDAYGGAQPNISSKKIEAMDISIPPLPEQRAIVAKIEQLFSELDHGVAQLKKAQAQLKVYKQAVLKKAFEGEFKSEKLKNLTTKIGSGSTPRGGKSSYHTEGIPLVRSLNIHSEFIRYRDLAFINEEQARKLDNVIIEKGDVLLNITGASIGRVNIAPEDFEKGRVNQHVSILRPNENLLNKFLKYYIQSPHIQDWIFNENYGVTRQALTKTAQESMKIPLPTLKEQTQIVHEIESRFSVVEQLEKELKENLQKAESLRQSILKQAFEGKLLTEAEIEACKKEKDWEPAEKLLERIQKETKN